MIDEWPQVLRETGSDQNATMIVALLAALRIALWGLVGRFSAIGRGRHMIQINVEHHKLARTEGKERTT